jgi:hypothetical protein
VAGSAEDGGVGVVPIRIISSVGIGTVRFEIVYDPAVLRFRRVDTEPLMSARAAEMDVVQPGRVQVVLISDEEI